MKIKIAYRFVFLTKVFFFYRFKNLFVFFLNFCILQNFQQFATGIFMLKNIFFIHIQMHILNENCVLIIVIFVAFVSLLKMWKWIHFKTQETTILCLFGWWFFFSFSFLFLLCFFSNIISRCCCIFSIVNKSPWVWVSHVSLRCAICFPWIVHRNNTKNYIKKIIIRKMNEKLNK